MTKMFCRKCCSYIVIENPNDGDTAYEQHMLACHADEMPDIDPRAEESMPEINPDDIAD